MRYLLMVFSSRAGWNALSQEELAALGPGHAAPIKELVGSGEWVGGSSPERAAAIAARIPDARLVAVEVRPVAANQGLAM